MTGRAVLVTGAGSGIGLAITQALLQAGHTVFAGARRPAHLQMLQLIGATALPLDARDAAQVQQVANTIAASIAAEGHGLHGLVHNAGIGGLGVLQAGLPKTCKRSSTATSSARSA